jgi:hypothetical protein
MRGADIHQETLFSTVIPEERVPWDYPLRPIREMVNKALKELDADFNDLYSDLGGDRPAGRRSLPSFLCQVLSQAEGADLSSKEHFSVDGTLIEALASHKR